MRVALVHDFHAGDTPSGENEVVEAEAGALERAGVAVEVVGARNDELARRPLHALQAAATVTTGLGISPLRRLEGFRPDVIHVHNTFPYLGHTWLRRATVPVVATLHSFRPLCANGYLFRDGAVCTQCPDGKPWSGVRYGCYRDSRVATLPLAWAGRNGAAGDPLIRAARRVLVLSDRSQALFAAAGVEEAKLVRDWHFVPDPPPEADVGEARAGWLFVGRLTPEKGVDALVDEWPSSVPLRLLGDGPLRGRLEMAAVGKQVEFLGRRSRKDVLVEMRRSFGLVVPSRWYETHSLVYIEGLAAGLPTLAFRPNIVADAVERDRTGAVAVWGELAARVAWAHEHFDGLRKGCRERFQERYAEDAFVGRRLRLYQELLR